MKKSLLLSAVLAFVFSAGIASPASAAAETGSIMWLGFGWKGHVHGNGGGSWASFSVKTKWYQPNKGGKVTIKIIGCDSTKPLATSSSTARGVIFVTAKTASIPTNRYGKNIRVVAVLNDGETTTTKDATPPSLRKYVATRSYFNCPAKAMPEAWSFKWGKKSGTAKVKRTVGVTPPVLSAAAANSAVKVKYQWYANGKKIKGATKPTYKVSKARKGKKLTVKVSVVKSGYKTKSKTYSFGRVKR